MSFSINTNVASLQAQNYLRTNSEFQGKTINRVTSGLRIIQSGDDAAGLAIANGYRSDEAVLTQGVRNANDGLSQLQIIDGGMSNISQLLDRARTLATQSATGTFTGDRGVLNSEFQNVLGEIDRQSQAVGLNTNGVFAKNLSVFIGGGKSSNGVSSIANGAVAVDLSQSSVDSQSLGLKGVQASGVAGTDIGTGSKATTLASILANTTNTGSEGTANYASFALKGPGFDSNGVNISVNLQNLGGTSDLVSAINAAISSAANGGTQQATALKNANITASVVTDSSGAQRLAFSSSTAAFQVNAGDRMSNALMGNFEQNAVALGTDAGATVDTSAIHTLSFKFDGSVAEAISVNVGSSATESKGAIVNALNADTSFKAAGVASLQGNQIVIKSLGNSSTSAVTVVHTALSQSVGLDTGADKTYAAAAANTGAALTTQVQSAGAVSRDVATYIGTNSAATVDITAGDTVILTVGATGPTTLTMDGGAGKTKDDIAADLNTKIGLGALNGKVAASVVDNKIVFSATSAGDTITVGAGLGTVTGDLGLADAGTAASNTFVNSDAITFRFQGAGMTSPVDVALGPITSGSTTLSSVMADLQNRVSTNSTLSAAGISLSTSSTGNNLVFTSTSGQQFQVAVTGDSQNKFGMGSFKAGAAGAFDYSTITGTAYGTGVANGANAAATAGVKLGGVFTPGAVALDLSGGTTGTIQLRIDGVAKTVALGILSTGTTADMLTAFTSALGAAGTASLDSTGHLEIASSGKKGAGSTVEVLTAGSDAATLATLGLTAGIQSGTDASHTSVQISLNGGAPPTTLDVSLNGAATDATAAVQTGADLSSGSVTLAAAGDVNLKIDGVAVLVALGTGATTTTAILAKFKTALDPTGAKASLDSTGHLQITSGTKGAGSIVEITAGTANELGLTAGTQRGANASETNVIDQINSGIAKDASLSAAGLSAKDDGSGKIVLSSNNGTNFRVNSYGTGDLGFGNKNAGSSFAGNSVSAAPQSAQGTDSGGAAMSTVLGFTDMLYGGDKQTVAVTGVDATGAKHSLGVVLQNSGANRSGETIDEAVSTINTALQKSNDATLQQVVAVKDNTGGSQSIRFISNLASFQVSVGNTAGGTGIAPPAGNVSSATVVGEGANSSILDQSSAQSAVTALSSAISNLGRAQAVVGRGQNQFGYAVNLAQSQLTNLATAESRIRDADLASEAANLTKAQVLIQAGVAALAQANSAPQQVLTLLRG